MNDVGFNIPFYLCKLGSSQLGQNTTTITDLPREILIIQVLEISANRCRAYIKPFLAEHDRKLPRTESIRTRFNLLEHHELDQLRARLKCFAIL